MNRGSTFRVVLAGVLLSVAVRVLADVEPEGLARYQAIVDRAPFGAVSAAGDKVPIPNFAERYTFAGLAPSALTNQVLAVLHDSSHNRSELVAVGDMIDDIKVVRIDAQGENSSVTIQQGLETAKLPLKARDTPIAGVGNGPGPIQPAQPIPGMPPSFGPGSPPVAGRPVLPPRRGRIPFRRGEQ